MCAPIKCLLRGILDASHSEILTIWKGIELAKELHFSHIIVESDFPPLVQKLRTSSPVDNAWHLINQLHQRIGEDGSIKVVYNPKKFNVPAHLLAQHACEVEDTITWLEEAPLYIHSTLMADLQID